MITTITFNPSVDKTYVIDGFRPNSMNRASNIFYNAGSKGVNVSRVLHQLGCDTVALGFIGGMYGDILLNHRSAEGIREDFIRVSGSTRLNIKIVDSKTSGVTEINEMGESVTDSELRQLNNKIAEWADKSKVIVLSGSKLPLMQNSVYANIAKDAAAKNVPLYLDCGGATLREGINGKPYCVKCNLTEFEEMLGKRLTTDQHIVDESKAIIEKKGLTQVIITTGAKGCIGVTKDEIYKVTPQRTVVSCVVGAGDAFMAGLCFGKISGFDFVKQLKFATSCATAKVAKEANNTPSLIELLGYIDGISVEEIN